MNEIKNFSDDQLVEELKKRKLEQENVLTMPEPLESPDFSPVIEQCKELKKKSNRSRKNTLETFENKTNKKL